MRRVASPRRTHLSAEVELVQLGRGGEELAEVVVLRHHRVRQRQRCDHVEERRSHLIARGGVVRPIVGDAHGLRPYRNGRPRTGTGTGRAHARRHKLSPVNSGQAHGDAQSAKLSTQRHQPESSPASRAPPPSQAGVGVSFYVACCMLQWCCQPSIRHS